MWTMKLDGVYVTPFFDNHGFNRSFQDLPETYIANGSLYLATSDTLRTYNSFLSPRTIPLIINSEIEALDIDTDIDFRFAQFLIS